jgi:hypothetical protein
MRRALLAAILATSLLTACDPASPPSLGEVFTDPGSLDVPAADVPGDVADDGTTDTPADVLLDFGTDTQKDTAPDESTDTPTDTPADLPTDTPTDTPTDACTPVLCDLYCPHGYRVDAAGCEACSCRQCETAKDCAPMALPCDKPVCGEAGMCLCDCAGKAPQDYGCPDGTLVPWCACGPLGWDCVARPEERCPTLCVPGRADAYPCPDGSNVPWCECTRNDCVPECRNVGTDTEGWYDTCTGALVVQRACQSCHPFCQAIGTRSEGWSDDCGDGLIAWGQCGPRRTCDDKAPAACTTAKCTVSDASVTFACPDGTAVPQCACEVPDGPCPPECLYAGTKSEGWYDGCSGALVRYATCRDCSMTCDNIGNKSEGWYSSCDGLIGWAQCGTGTWACSATPWDGCTNHAAACVGEGGGTILSTASACCPGLATIEVAAWDGAQCLFPDCLCGLCTYCGDGRCVPPENRCNCATDCLPGTPALPRGGLCQADADCLQGLSCIGAWASTRLGVCSSMCNPMSMGPGAPCDPGFACVIVPESQAPGFCLAECGGDRDCAYPLTCGVFPDATFPKACYDWSPFR